MDYCDIRLAGTADIQMLQCQSVQNTAARLVSEVRRWDYLRSLPPLASVTVRRRIALETAAVFMWKSTLWRRSCLSTETLVLGCGPASTAENVSTVHTCRRCREYRRQSTVKVLHSANPPCGLEQSAICSARRQRVDEHVWMTAETLSLPYRQS